MLWDLDGTLTDSVRFVVDTANEVLASHQREPLGFDVIGGMTGQPLDVIFRHAVPDLTDHDVATWRAEYRAIYDERVIPATRLFRGARPTLREFRARGLRQATVTGKRAADCEKILRGLRIGDSIELFLGGDSVARPKPAPDLALLAIERLGVPAETAVVIGDTETDMRMGKDAGARTIQVLWGYEHRRLPFVERVARTWPELRRVVASMLAGDGPLRS